MNNMSGGYIKALLLHKQYLPLDTRIDIQHAIERALQVEVLDYTDILVLEYFLRGFTIDEIPAAIYKDSHNSFIIMRERIQERLERVFSIIAEYSGYTDDQFIKQYAPLDKHIKALTFIEQYSTDYTYHGIERE